MSMPILQAIVVGCSAGGLNALHVLLAGLPVMPVPVIVLCHSGSEDMRMFCELLQRNTSMPVIEAEERSRPLPGHVYVAPSGYHLLIEQDGRFALNIDERVQYSRPSIDVLFETAASAWGSGALAVLMTGANADGATGAASIRKVGGTVVIEDPQTAAMPAMPLAALQRAGADYCLPLAEIAPLLERLCGAQQ